MSFFLNARKAAVFFLKCFNFHTTTLNGTTDWQYVELILQEGLPPAVAFDFYVGGSVGAWADDLEFKEYQGNKSSSK